MEGVMGCHDYYKGLRLNHYILLETEYLLLCIPRVGGGQ